MNNNNNNNTVIIIRFVERCMGSYRGAGEGVEQAGYKQQLNRNVFKCLLKLDSRLQSKMFASKPFHATGAEYEKERL